MDKVRVGIYATLVATAAALGIAAALPQGPAVHEDFSSAPDGIRTTTSTGQAVSLHPSSGPRTPRVVDGWLTYSPTAEHGGYYTVELDKPVTSAGAEFAFTPWTKHGGLFSIAFMEDDIAATQPNVPRSPMHFTISPTAWSIDVFPTVGQPAKTVLGGQFDEPLAADGTTVHKVSIELVDGTVKVTLPDGSTVEAEDPTMRVPATYVFIEPFRIAGDPEMTVPKIRSWWAD